MYRCHVCATVWEKEAPACPFCGGHRIDPQYAPSRYAKQINAEIAGYLQPLTERLVAELKEIVQEPMPAGTHLLEFEVHFSFQKKTFPIRWDPKDVEKHALFGGDPLMDGKDPAFPAKFFNNSNYEDLDLTDFGLRAIEKWFADCWQKAGGDACPHPTYFRLHESHVALDLRTRKLVKDQDRWPAAEQSSTT
jgi:hypothetical protein